VDRSEGGRADLLENPFGAKSHLRVGGGPCPLERFTGAGPKFDQEVFCPFTFCDFLRLKAGHKELATGILRRVAFPHQYQETCAQG